jgi:5-methylcytosine-specific restriction endonuclease McrA/mono/diheme cytochrome c family protein
MAVNRRNALYLVAAMIALFVIAASLTRPTHGNPSLPIAHQGPAKPTKLYYGVAACSSGGCHDNPVNPNQKDILLCNYDEVRIWSKQDKHRDASKVLKSERGRQMAKLLGIKGDITQEPSCISCHGVVVEDKKFIHEESFDLSEGVSCGACHGYYSDWVDQHSTFLQRKKWRTMSRKVKWEQYGMRDLWDPEVRATLCVSCHIGNAAEGKVVTHAMYAAGHPPLPGVELATFSDAMPRHWKYLSEKPANVQKILEYDPAKSAFERSELVVVSALVAFRESMNLLATQAEQGGDAKDADKSWPELAQFDCIACHHDLKSDSWRQKRGYAGKPGRPMMREWASALLPIAVLHISKGGTERETKLAKELRDKLKELTATFDAQPFGEPRRVAKTARDAAAWADDLLKERRTIVMDHTGAKNMLTGLGKEAKARTLDFDSARQFVWAFRAIQSEADPKWAAQKDAAAALKELDEQLKLNFPKGQVEITKDFLRESLDSLNNYEPERFRRAFDALIAKQKP